MIRVKRVSSIGNMDHGLVYMECDIKPKQYNQHNFYSKSIITTIQMSERVAQSATCLIADTCLTVDSGVASLISVLSHTFGEIDHEIFLLRFSTLPLIPEGLLPDTN